MTLLAIVHEYGEEEERETELMRLEIVGDFEAGLLCDPLIVFLSVL